MTVLDDEGKSYTRLIDINVIQVDADGDGVSDYEDVRPEDSVIAYYSNVISDDGLKEVEYYTSATGETKIEIITTYTSDGDIDTVVSIDNTDTEKQVTTYEVYESGISAVDSVVEEYEDDDGVYWEVTFDALGVTVAMILEEETELGDKFEKYYNSEL